MCVGRPTQNGMISTLEIHNFKCQLFLTVILGITENHVKGDLAESFGFLSRDNTMKTHIALAKLGHRNAHPLQGFSIKDIQAATTIHQHFSQSSAFNNWVDH